MTGPASPARPARLELSRVVVPGHAPLDLVVGGAEMVAVLGAGSSGLLWAVAGLGPPVPGEMFVDGRRTDEQTRPAGVALIAQGGALATLLTAFENVLLPLAERRASPDPAYLDETPGDHDVVAVARQALDAVGLADFADHLVEDLSGGQQQRVAVARAIAGRPRLLLADQATTDLDAGNRTRVVGLLRDLAASGAAVVLASDDPAVVAACDRTVVLEPEGRRQAQPDQSGIIPAG